MTGMPQKIKALSFTLHPQDSRLVKTGYCEIFMASVRNAAYAGAILDRSEDEKAALRTKFHDFRRQFSGQASAMYDERDGEIISFSIPAPLKVIEPELRSMAQLYNAMSGEKQIEVLVATNIVSGAMHFHDFSVMNCNWFCDGTIWENESGARLNAGEGNIFFFRHKLKHVPQPLDWGPGRVLLVAMPQCEFEL